MTLKARDVMQTNPITVSPDASLTQAHRLFAEEEISGAPVVDDDGRVVGVVSSTDLIRAIPEELDEGSASRPADFQEDEPYLDGDEARVLDELVDPLPERKISEVMTRDLISVTSDTPVTDVARVMRNGHIHRVLVIDDGVLHGIITTFDLIQLLESSTQVGGSAS
jgi:CBS domain-containing protein